MNGIEELLRNSCDGCCAGHSLQNGMHIDERGKAYMMCQAYKYKPRHNCDTNCKHDSDCSLHNEPAYPTGACDCSRGKV